jgi:hypothetical protein
MEVGSESQVNRYRVRHHRHSRSNVSFMHAFKLD